MLGVECLSLLDSLTLDAVLPVDRVKLVLCYFDERKLFVEGNGPRLQAVAHLFAERFLGCQIVDVLLSEFTEIRSCFQSFLLLPFTFFVDGRWQVGGP